MDEVIYAGAHGFDIAGVPGRLASREVGGGFRPSLIAAEQSLRTSLAGIDGCLIEGKKYAIAIHYRLVADDQVETIREGVERVAGKHSDLKITEGKKIFELRPNLDWDKGTALRWIFENLGFASGDVVPIYIGDDITDYDAFEAIKSDGLGVLVAENPPTTPAKMFVHNVDQVASFLKSLTQILEERTT